MLLDCTRFGAVTIPYDFQGTTLDSLVLFLKLRLAGRHAKYTLNSFLRLVETSMAISDMAF